jgi:uroporphyrinogen-III synthase
MEAMNSWQQNNMPDRRYTILSTASIPYERVPHIPDSVELQVIPFIEIVPCLDEFVQKQILELAAKKTTVVFTSAHAVGIVTKLLTTKPDWTIYCIRHETRKALAFWFGDSYEFKTADNAKSLSEHILTDAVSDITFFCGDQRMNTLPDHLRKNNILLNEIVVYTTKLAPVQIVKHPDAILFFSPTAVKSFFSINELSPHTAIFAMGKTTADALKKFTRVPVIISPEADKLFVLNMAMEYACTHPVI